MSIDANIGQVYLYLPLAGMVSICAGCNGYYPWATALISFAAAVLYVFLSRWDTRYLTLQLH